MRAIACNHMRLSLRAKAILVPACVGALAVVCMACAAPQPAKSTSLDLSNTGLTDVSDLMTRTDLTALDLTGDPITYTQFDALQSALPNCNIRWSVPVGEAQIESDATTLDVSCTAEQLSQALPYLKSLEEVTLQNASETDYAALTALNDAYPVIKFHWNVTIAGAVYAQDTEALTLDQTSVSVDELATALAGLPTLKEVHLGGTVVLTTAQQLQLQQTYPTVSFDWTVALLEDVQLSSKVEQIDLRGNTVTDATAFADALALFPNLTYADLCGCGLSDEQMIALRERYPKVKFVWLIRVNGWEIRTDIKGFSTGQRRKFPDDAGAFVGKKHSYGSITNTDLEKLTLCTDLVALDVGHCTHIGNIDFIARLPKLKYLIVSLCDITDISPIANQTDLEFLEIKYNYLTDLTPLANLKKLRYLNCSNNLISDFSVLTTLPKLERLWISMNNFTMDQVEELQKAMPNTLIKASLTNSEYAESLWRKDNEGYLAMQALFGLRAQNQGTKED